MDFLAVVISMPGNTVMRSPAASCDRGHVRRAVVVADGNDVKPASRAANYHRRRCHLVRATRRQGRMDVEIRPYAPQCSHECSFLVFAYSSSRVAGSNHPSLPRTPKA